MWHAVKSFAWIETSCTFVQRCRFSCAGSFKRQRIVLVKFIGCLSSASSLSACIQGTHASGGGGISGDFFRAVQARVIHEPEGAVVIVLRHRQCDVAGASGGGCRLSHHVETITQAVGRVNRKATTPRKFLKGRRKREREMGVAGTGYRRLSWAIVGLNLSVPEGKRPFLGYVPSGIRTRVTGVKGRRPGPLDDGDIRVFGDLAFQCAWNGSGVWRNTRLLNSFCAHQQIFHKRQ